MKALHPDMAVLFATGYASVQTAIQALENGASGYATKPLNIDELLSKVTTELEKHRLICEKRVAEEAVLEAKRMLEEAQRIALMGSWDWDIVAGKVVYSDETCRICGVNPKDFRTFEDFTALIHPDDAESNLQAVEAALGGKAPYRIEYRIIRADGIVRWLQVRGEVVHDEAGKPERLRGYAQDITDRRLMEETLHLTQFSTDRGADAAFWMESDARFFYVNEQACRSIGYSEQELLTMTVHDIDPNFPREAWAGFLWKY